jgi:long-subunit acyl-CoA synthetase (AMP-forming)
MRLFNDDIQVLKPTMIPAVPNVLNRMYEKVIVKYAYAVKHKITFFRKMSLSRKYSFTLKVVRRMNSSNLRRVIFNMALKRKTKEVERGIYQK